MGRTMKEREGKPDGFGASWHRSYMLQGQQSVCSFQRRGRTLVWGGDALEQETRRAPRDMTQAHCCTCYAKHHQEQGASAADAQTRHGRTRRKARDAQGA